MNRKNLPLLLMLTAGAVTSIITYVEQYPLTGKLVALFIVLLLFYVLGTILKWTLDYFEKQNEERLRQESEEAGDEEQSGDAEQDGDQE